MNQLVSLDIWGDDIEVSVVEEEPVRRLKKNLQEREEENQERMVQNQEGMVRILSAAKRGCRPRGDLFGFFVVYVKHKKLEYVFESETVEKRNQWSNIEKITEARSERMGLSERNFLFLYPLMFTPWRPVN